MSPLLAEGYGCRVACSEYHSKLRDSSGGDWLHDAVSLSIEISVSNSQLRVVWRYGNGC